MAHGEGRNVGRTEKGGKEKNDMPWSAGWDVKRKEGMERATCKYEGYVAPKFFIELKI